MDRPPKEGKAWAFSVTLALPALLFPIYNPDLFWHLSAGRWMFEHRALPRMDFLSFTRTGAPWQDFEWLSQLVFAAVHAWAGMTGLWLLKGVLLLSGWLVLHGLLKLYGISSFGRAAGLALWSAGALPYSDIRPELFSILFFTVVLRVLEGRRMGQRTFGPRAWAGFFGLFAVWASLHAGFAFGLILIALYAAVEAILGSGARAREFAVLAAAGAAGSVCQPYGLGPHQVGFEHWLARGELSRHIAEWHPLTFENPLHWPDWLLLAACGGLILYRAVFAGGSWKERLPWAPVLAAGYFGAAMLAHSRASAFFSVTGAAVLFLIGRELKPRRPAVLAGLLGYALYLLWAAPFISWSGTFNYKHVPRAAAEFMARERAAFEGLKLYNVWEWGGYLGWRLHPWYRVYGDGRYLFHPDLAETQEAASDAPKWREFMVRRGLDGALLPNLDTRLEMDRVYPDGTRKSFARPWYVSFMPKDRWALVYWDEQTLLFVDRRQAAPGWLDGHEYRCFKPKDEAAFADALARGEILAARLAQEKERHAWETGF